MLIEKVTAGSPADEAGLHGSYKPAQINGEEVLIGGDIITAVDGSDISKMQEIADIISSSESGTTLSLSILRDGEEIVIDITLGEKPE